MKVLRGVLFAAVPLALLAGVVWWTTRPQPFAVTIATLANGTVEATVANTRAGTVSAHRRAKLAPPTGGQVSRLFVREGDRVVADQVLVELWHDDLSAQLALAQRQVEQSKAVAEAARLRAELAERQAARWALLREQDVASEDLLDKAASGAKAAHADLLAADAEARVREAQIATIQAALDRTVVRAPFAGIIAEVNGELGEFVTPSPVGIPTPPAIDLIDDSSLYVTAPIDEVDAARVQVGMTVRVSLDAFGKRPLAGKVRRIAPYVLDREKQARTADVEVDLLEVPADVHLLAGYSADAEILLEAHTEVLRVPSEAVRDGDRVLVVGSDGVVAERAFTRGLANWRFVEVLAGLQVGDRVVVGSDQPGLGAGDRVTITAARAPEAGP